MGEACNYYSWIYYREVGSTAIAYNSTALFRKIATQNISDFSEQIEFSLVASSLESRHDSRAHLTPTSDGAERTSTPPVGAPMGGSDCGRLEVYAMDEVLVTSGVYEIFDEERASVPLCISECIWQG